MAPPTRVPPSKWIDQGLRALAAGGPDAVRVEVLARALGVTKGSFYNHFGDRSALLDEMLDTWEQIGVDRVIERVEAEGGDGRAKLRRLRTVTSSTRDRMNIELAIREWARRDPVVAKRLRGIDNRRMDYMRSLFREFCSDPKDVEVRCLLAFSLWMGGRTIAANHGPYRRAELSEQAMEWLLEATSV